MMIKLADALGGALKTIEHYTDVRVLEVDSIKVKFH